MAVPINTASWQFRSTVSTSITRRENKYPVVHPQQMALLALIHWGMGLLGMNALFILPAQPHYAYGDEEPHIKISICANDHTIPSGLLCPLNRPIFQLWSADRSVFFYNLIIFVMLTLQKDFFFFPSPWSQTHQHEMVIESIGEKIDIFNPYILESEHLWYVWE